MGNFLNTGILLILLCIFDVTTVANQKAHPNRLGGVWRTAFGIGLIPIIAIIFYRVVYLRVRRLPHLSATVDDLSLQLHSGWTPEPPSAPSSGYASRGRQCGE